MSGKSDIRSAMYNGNDEALIIVIINYDRVILGDLFK